MNKIFKRLLSVVLALVMVVTLVPLGKPVTVEAADEKKTIYLDTRNYVPNGWGEAYIYLWINGTDNSGRTYKMNPVTVEVGGDPTTVPGLFSYDVPTEYTHLIFKPNQNSWERQTANQTIPSDQRNLFTCTTFGNRTSGTWGVYSGTGSDNNFPSNVTGTVTFFDLYTDTEINALDNDNSNDPEYYGLENWRYRVYDQPGTSHYYEKSASEGRSFTSIGRAFSKYVNPAISSYWSGNNSVYPIYFGNFQPFYMIQPANPDGNSIFTIDPWWVYSNSYKSTTNTFDRNGYMNDINSLKNFSWFLNRSIDTNNRYESDRYGAVVQGIVGDELDDNGNIVAKGTNIPLPQFNPEFYNSSSVGKMYQPMEFPFVVREIDGATYYQFDSGVNGSSNHDTVRLNSDGTGLIYSDDPADVVYGITADGTKSPGFFPFNSPEDSKNADSYYDEDNKLNYGFGMKLEIEFTMDSDGMVETTNGDRIPATFAFSGDDDVWIYVDDKLALDLGGSHGVAQGELDFSQNKAVVQYVKSVDGNTDAERAVAVEKNEYVNNTGDFINQVSDRVSVSENTGLETNGQNVKTFEFDKSDETEIHTLTIFYEERGMFESNFKATFNLEQPTVLKTTNTVNVDNVNSALQDITKKIAAKDNFTYSLNTADGTEKSGTPVSGKNYTTESGGTATCNGQITLNDGGSATFTKQFDRDSGLELIQTENKRYSTSWTMSELSDAGVGKGIAASYEEGKDPLTVGDGRISGEKNTGFKLANIEDDESVPARVQIDYVQNPQTGGIAIQKEMETNVSSDDAFEFQVTLSNVFGGESEEQAYDLTYDIYSSNGESSTIVRKDVIAEDGVVSIKAGQFALINGIPVGTEYKVVEKEKVEYSVKGIDTTTYYSNDTNVSGDLTSATVTGTVVADLESNVDMFVYTNGIKTLDDSFLVEIGKENTLNVIPTVDNDGELSGDLAEINEAWTTSEATRKGIVFIVDGKPYIDQNNKPISETTVSDVTYKASIEDGAPIIKVTPGADDIKETEKISVQYQLVELNADGTVKYNQVPDPEQEGQYIDVLASITPVITATNYLYKANDDIYVLDYGLDVDLADRSADSGMFQNDVLENSSLTGSTSTYWNTAKGISNANASASTKMDQNTKEVTGDHGKITPVADTTNGFAISNSEGNEKNPKVTYSMGEFLSDKDYYNYNVMVNKSENLETGQTSNRFRVNLTSNVTVMPASVVYYEDNFNADTSTEDSSVKIIYTGDEENIKQEGTSLELTQSNGQTEQYGHDDAYNTTGNQNDSGGSSTKLTANGYNTKATFTFTGTGFDIIARTTSDTAGIIYTIEAYDADTDSYSLSRMGAVDTYYVNGDLYQIPVIHEDVSHGTYRVTLGINATSNGNEVIYLDGIRIYNPLGTLDTEESDAYLDTEEGAEVDSMHDLVVGDGVVTETGIFYEDEEDENGGYTEITGQFIEGAKSAIVGYSLPEEMLTALGTTQTEASTDETIINTPSILTYLNAGPNNEVYLDETAALAFVVKATDETTNTLQIEAKLVDTNNAYGSEESAGVDLRVLSKKGDSIEETTVDTIKTSTAMFYEINVEENCIALDDGYYLVVILGNSDTEDGGTHSLSFSNLKYKNYTIGSPYDTTNYDTSSYIKSLESADTNKFVSVDAMTGLIKNTWYRYNHTVTLSEDVFNGETPEFKMYYVNAAGKPVSISVKAQRDTNNSNIFKLLFKTPNAKGNFPVQIYYVVGGEESSEYISTTMSVKR